MEFYPKWCMHVLQQNAAGLERTRVRRANEKLEQRTIQRLLRRRSSASENEKLNLWVYFVSHLASI